MSLRQPTCLTPPRLAAARRNAQHSTGPRTSAGKERMKMNALKHGGDAAPENHSAVMRALGEDPAAYDALKRELMLAYGPGDPLWNQQLEDLAQLYWRRRRLERMQTGLMRSALQQVEEQQRERAQAIAAATFDPSCLEATEVNLGQSDDLCVQLRLLLSLLGVLREQAKRQVFNGHQEYLLQAYHSDEIGWRWGRFRRLLGHFVKRAQAEEKHDKKEWKEFMEIYFPGGKAQMQAEYQELLRLYEEEIAAVEAEFEHQLKVQEERDALERDTCLAPAGETWEMLLRQEAALDRSIDRKVRIILAMRRDHARQVSQAASPPDEVPELLPEVTETLGLDPAEVAGTCPEAGGKSANAPTGRGATDIASESPVAEDAGKTSKSAEQSENVPENKAPAAEEVHA